MRRSEHTPRTPRPSVCVLAIAGALGLLGCGSDASPGGGGGAAGDSGASGGVAGAASGGTGGGDAGGAAGADGGVVPAGSRVLAMEIDPPAGEDYAAELDVAMGQGVTGVPTTLPWTLLEPSPNQIDTSWIAALNAVFVPRGVHALLSIPAMDTVSLLVPSDLAPGLQSGALAFDDPSVIARFDALLDAVLGAMDPSLDVRYLLVGNEVNVYLANRPDSAWQSYKAFIDAARSHVHSQRPDIAVGVNVSFNGPAGLDAKIQDLVSNQDAYFVSYYQNGNAFGGTQSNDIASDVATMSTQAGSKPLVLKEFGYPTGVSGNSPAGQVDFIDTLFTTWDENAARIPYVVISRMFDGALADCTSQAADYGFPGDQQFILFLCTLGLRSYEDQPKPAWDALGQRAQARGF